MKVFISYSRHDEAAVRALAGDLERARVQVWLDEDLGGGDAWWSTIIGEILDCSVFIFALSDQSIYSKPCRAELGYAQLLGLPILPVQIGELTSYRIDPIFNVQMVDYRTPTAATGFALMGALHGHAAHRGALPDPVPEPPPIPYEYLQRIGTSIHGNDELPPSVQRQILSELRGALDDEDEASVLGDVRHLLLALRRRPDVTYPIASEIDATLGDAGDGSATAAGPQGQRPVSPVASSPPVPQPVYATATGPAAETYPPAGVPSRPPNTAAKPVERAPWLLALRQRNAAVCETWISALLILPALVFYATVPYGYEVWTVHWLVTKLPAELYLVAVVAILGRTHKRRALAIALALLGAVIERALVAPLYSQHIPGHPYFYSDDFYAGMNADFQNGSAGASGKALFFAYASMILLVAAWGVARRRNRLWLIGIPVSLLIISAAWAVAYQPRQLLIEGPWLSNRVFDIGVFVVCCLACWGFDAWGTSRNARSQPRALPTESDAPIRWAGLAAWSGVVVVLTILGLLLVRPPAQPVCFTAEVYRECEIR